MRRVLVPFLIFTLIIVLNGCQSNHMIRSGGLNVINTEIPENKLIFSEIESDKIEYNTLFGVRTDVVNKPTKSTIINLNGINSSGSSTNLRPLQILTFITTSVATIFSGRRLMDLSPTAYTDQDYVLVSIGSVALSGIINESIWKKHHYNTSMGSLNNSLLENNQEIDYFINPSFNTTTTSSPFSSKRILSGKAIGVQINDSLFINSHK